MGAVGEQGEVVNVVERQQQAGAAAVGRTLTPDVPCGLSQPYKAVSKMPKSVPEPKPIFHCYAHCRLPPLLPVTSEIATACAA